MNFSNIEYFLATEQERSFTLAARRLHITQQTLSASIAGLETELGTRLFTRNVPLQLTYAGEVFLKYARSFHSSYETMTREFEDIKQFHRGILKVGIGYTRGRLLMPAIIEAFQKEYPCYQIQLVENSNQELKKMLVEGYIDIAIASFHRNESGIRLYDFYEEEIVLLMSHTLLNNIFKDDKEGVIRELSEGNLSALSEIPFLLGLPEDLTGEVSRRVLSGLKKMPQVSSISDNMETLLALCVRNLGACFCPDKLALLSLSEESRKRLHVFSLPGKTPCTIRFGVRRENDQWTIISDFMRIAKESDIFLKESGLLLP